MTQDQRDRLTDTPETNAAEFPCMRWLSREHPMGVRSELAKRLERERDEAREQLTAVTEQRDRLATILQGIRSGYGGQIPDPTCDCGDCEFLITIDNALQYITKPNQ